LSSLLSLIPYPFPRETASRLCASAS